MTPTFTSRQKSKTQATTVNELAARWSTTPRKVRALIACGKLRAFKLGPRSLRIPEDEIEAYLRRSEEGRV
ncbi:helix-turn-helix domain-containing protein [Planctomycetota bacterium]